jgi:MFS transporter, DHA1 family, tetracycline resistance protein
LRKRTLLLVFLVVFIDLMGFGIVIPLLPLYAKSYHPTPQVFGLLMATYSLMQFLFAPILGRLSDRFGRRPVLLISLAGTVAAYLLFAFQHTLEALFLARAIGGLFGANVSTAQAVIADVTAPDERAKGMGLIGAAFGLGFILGPAIGSGALRLGENAPGLFAAGLSFCAFLLALLTLEETYPEERHTGELRVHRGWFTPARMWRALTHPQLGLVFGAFFLTTFAFSNFEATFALTLKDRLGLDTKHIFWLFVFLGSLAAIIQGGLIGRLAPRFGERKLAVIGAAILVPGYLLLAQAQHVPALLGSLTLLALGAGLTNPTLSALASRLATADEQGGVLGVYQSLSSMARIFGPFWGVYAFEKFGTSSAHITAAAVTCLVFALALRLLYRKT